MYVKNSTWSAFLSLPLAENIYKKAMEYLVTNMLPNISHSKIFLDLMTKSLHKGGLVGALSIKGIYLLSYHNQMSCLHPFKQLYTLLSSNNICSTSKEILFGLTAIFFRYSMVPDYSRQAFVNRLARMSISTSCERTLICLALIHTLTLGYEPRCKTSSRSKSLNSITGNTYQPKKNKSSV